VISCCAAPQPESSSAAVSSDAVIPVLNSEHIRQKFGSYGIDVVRDSGGLRVSNLFSIEDGRKIMRTLAAVMYPSSIPPAIQAEHREIESGQAIGEVFRRHGWEIKKRTLYIGEIAAAPEFAGVYSAMGGIRPASLAVHIYQLWVERKHTRLCYATIAEVHHPQYLGSRDLEEIYQSADDAPWCDNEGLRQALTAVTEAMKEF